jgi:hypothetical protein
MHQIQGLPMVRIEGQHPAQQMERLFRLVPLPVRHHPSQQREKELIKKH